MAQRRYTLTHDRPGPEDRFFVEALDPAQWAPAAGGDWHTRWQVGMPRPETFARVIGGRSINHIPGNHCLTVKSALADTLAGLTGRLAAIHGEDSPIVRRSRFTPQTFCMPDDHARLLAKAAAHPRRLWLQKPANGARGEGIRVLRDPAEAPTGEDWVVQHYLDDPHLIDGRKYVLRLYVLISSTEPLRVYLYREGFAKLASHAYTLDDLADPFVHQTNPDINAGNTGMAEPVVFIELARYRERLRAEGRDPEALFRRLRELITITVIAARETLRSATLATGADPQGCYEFLGLDCLVDADMNPWLLECNLNPSLGVYAGAGGGGDAEGRIKRAMVHDLVSLLGLNAPDRPRADARAEAGPLAAAADAELAAAGDFERIFPDADAARYWPYFPAPRPADLRLAGALADTAIKPPPLRPWQVEEVFGDDGLRLFATETGQWLAPNPTAALIWLHVADGLDPLGIAAELAALPGAGNRAAIEWDVLTTLADWARDGLLRQVSAWRVRR
ncbi:hypothetical protein [Spiribacter insolitus]|uniref:Tubulin-tyrosine ligase family protein n=1 Tax=Spiribacter insolitus TaxID=3122417 RepID=A0ABV3T783_9GAMM